MPVLVRNAEAGPTVFTDAATNTQVEWQGAGDPSGEDWQQVPDALVNNVAFLKAVNRGVLVIEEASDEARSALEAQSANWRRRQDEAAKASVDAISEEAQNDLITLSCVGPNQRGTGGECGEMVPVREKTKDDKPPLCSRHAALASQFVMTETDVMVEGKAQKKWIRSQVGARERQQV